MHFSGNWSHLVFNVSWLTVHLRLRLISFLYTVFGWCIFVIHLIKQGFHEGKCVLKYIVTKVLHLSKWHKISLVNFPVNLHVRKKKCSFVSYFLLLRKDLHSFRRNLSASYPDLISANYMCVFTRLDPINE